ncbi:gephyrin-like molybdotransferase Glp [Puniceibacterium sp. IMCC21224]|uniref:molybdenum cofactor synthesis domain-containing protein n=1 Tax=Puniceibacterium sp. IMCC21224 TaxID=1618204 RepID=UPI00064D9052|nr:gephyrin-like molybdotransferase Glp [Puniceibacterium sp. IMCC21224]KMK66605.1 molybdenum cofactor synthesis domain [Puniceibacterium sp. IMCC21224]
MSRFDTIVVVDWSGGNDRGLTPKPDAIWGCVARSGVSKEPVYLRNRQVAEMWLHDLIEAELAAGRRVLAGFDFPFGYPAGMAEALTGASDPLALWDWFEARIEDAPKANNRFDLAGRINQNFGGQGPFWGNGLRRDVDGLPRNKARYSNPFADRRQAELQAPGAFTCWQMAGAGSVGSQVFMGLPVLARLRRAFAGRASAWPFETPDREIALVEVWPSLSVSKPPEGVIKDAYQVATLARVLSALPARELDEMLLVSAPEEGWILGLGYEHRLVDSAATRPELQPPPLRNDCFALPAGIDWTPVDQALGLLRTGLHPVVLQEDVPVMQAVGRVLAHDLMARRSNPPHRNTAVDGYGFAAGSVGEGPQVLPLMAGRSAAGKPFDGVVPEGRALRVLTGADLPAGVDTVVLDEDVTRGTGEIAFRGALRRGANTREAGEDVARGALVLSAGRILTPADLALAAAVGHGSLRVFARLRVAVISTGDELVEAGAAAEQGQIYDANRPMLLAMAARWGFTSVDLGRLPDNRAVLRDTLDQAAQQADVILTSGGASAGDEDHVSALMRESGALQEWRIALKPGRPLVLGLWQGVPVFGLPGNPVAALVCALVFARPAMGILSGEGWHDPVGYDLPANFEKRKKPGRREYLRARVRNGKVEVFRSEGSGRISGLSWAEGLVELEDGACHVQPGDPVRYIPFGSFGL